MEKTPLDYLKDRVKFQGFGEKLFAELELQVLSGAKEFKLPYAKGENENKLEAVLHFKRSDTTEKVYFNSYDLKLTSSNEERQHTFYVNNGKGLVLSEAENLLRGRAVYKELETKAGQPYKAWLELNTYDKQAAGKYTIQKYHDNYGFDLEKAIKQMPLQLENEEAKEKLIKSLEKGNRTMATINENGQTKTVYLEAMPQSRNVLICDQQMTKELQQSKEQEQKQEQGKEEKKEMKQEQGKEEKKERGRESNSRKREPVQERGMSR